MDMEHAERVQPGDVVVYQSERRQVLAISHEGLWRPYFNLDGEGFVSHILVQAPAPQPVSSER